VRAGTQACCGGDPLDRRNGGDPRVRPEGRFHFRWRQEYGGLKGEHVKRLKELAAENARLRRAASDLTLEKLNLYLL
jgi:hypothetical protein